LLGPLLGPLAAVGLAFFSLVSKILVAKSGMTTFYSQNDGVPASLAGDAKPTKSLLSIDTT
jgi:hypothetical protein